MNDSTERLMKAWHPRQPSDGLRNRIFASEPSPAIFQKQPFNLAELTRWLVPALGCFMMVAATLTDPEMRMPDGGSDLASHRPAFLTAWHNNVPATTLEWTFSRPSSSSNDPFVRTETNTLIK